MPKPSACRGRADSLNGSFSHKVDSVRAVASIGAPYEPGHVEHNYGFVNTYRST